MIKLIDSGGYGDGAGDGDRDGNAGAADADGDGDDWDDGKYDLILKMTVTTMISTNDHCSCVAEASTDQLQYGTQRHGQMIVCLSE